MEQYHSPDETSKLNRVQQLQARPSIHSGKFELVKGEHVAMRLWVAERNAQEKDASTNERHYSSQQETVGYCLSGKAEVGVLEIGVLIVPCSST